MVKLIKMVSGEELISEHELNSTDNLIKHVLKNPVKLLMTQAGIGMMPFSPLSKSDTFSIDDKHIIYVMEPEEEVVNSYNEKFGSGIVIASNSSQIIV